MVNVQKPLAGLFLTLLLLPPSLCGTATVVSAQTTAPPASNEKRQEGIELYRQRKYAEAAKILRKALKSDSDDEGWYYLGLSLLHQPKELKQATKAFETALKLRPNFAAAHAGLAYCLLLRNKSSGALREAQSALDIDPNLAEAHYIIGVVRLREGAHEAALNQAEVAIKLSPQFPFDYWLKSQALVSFFGHILAVASTAKEEESQEARKARFGEAATALEKYLQLDPGANDRQTWIEQLESLRFYAGTHQRDGKKDAFSGKEVTTKARVLSKPEPSYTNEARSAQVTGTVVLRAVFAADGTVKHFLVVEGLPLGLTEASVKAARKIKFVPATIDSQPVSMFIQLEYNFNLY